MEAVHQDNRLTAETGRQGALTRQTAEECSALARYAAKARWHPREAQAAKEKAQEITYLIKQALKEGRQLPLF